MRPKVKFLTAIWGEEYIERFASLSLPSFLAPGNLPALAVHSDLEVVVLTRRCDFEEFEAQPAFRTLRSICATRFIDIDDLVAGGLYGFTLTLAYARAVMGCGPDMLNTHFVFMNADFVLSDGSLRSLLRHIEGGRSIVLGPSFRATAEAIEPTLRAAVDPSTNSLAISSRKLVALALANPHPTSAAKIVSQDAFHTKQPNQFFWKVDEHTMLGRFYLIFMLCLKPERMLANINTYCDYGFIPEMCPSGDEVVMSDSDDFFMLELQHWMDESDLLQRGGQTDRDIARKLSEWTTAEHRRAAGYDLYFHANDLSGVDRAKAQAATFIEKINKLLAAPIPHAHHRYWVDGIEMYQSLLARRDVFALPKEMDTPPFPLRSRLLIRSVARFAMRAVYRAMLGHAPKVAPLHPNWLDYHHLGKSISDVLNIPSAHVLVVRDESNLIDSLVRGGASVQFATVREILRGKFRPIRHDSGAYTHAVIYLRRKHFQYIPELVEKCMSKMNGMETACYVFIHDSDFGAEEGNFSQVFENVEDLLGRLGSGSAVSYVGGRLVQFNCTFFSRLNKHYGKFGALALLWICPALAVGIPFVFLTNIFLKRSLPTRHLPRHCTSVLLRFASGTATTS
jgi:hypothetical protein